MSEKLGQWFVSTSPEDLFEWNRAVTQRLRIGAASLLVYLQVGVILVVGTIVSVGDNNWNWTEPAQQIEPLQDLVLAYERHHKQGVQVEALTKHPKVVGDQEVVEQDVPKAASKLQLMEWSHPNKRDGSGGWLVSFFVFEGRGLYLQRVRAGRTWGRPELLPAGAQHHLSRPNTHRIGLQQIGIVHHVSVPDDPHQIVCYKR